MINTKQVTNRRSLHFNSVDELLAEAIRLAEAERDGHLKQLGNWTLGQACGHLAGWMNYAFDGYPMRPPWIVRFIGTTFLKKHVLRKPMRPGTWIPKIKDGTLATDLIPTDQALVSLSHACDRLRTQAPIAPNPIFGPLTHDEWIALNLRHGELHLSFFTM